MQSAEVPFPLGSKQHGPSRTAEAGKAHDCGVTARAEESCQAAERQPYARSEFLSPR
jgi:hypothetical protein